MYYKSIDKATISHDNILTLKIMGDSEITIKIFLKPKSGF